MSTGNLPIPGIKCSACCDKISLNASDGWSTALPHFGLMNAESLGPEQAALQRARLHLRGGRRRLLQGKTSAGIAALYDGLSSAMEWYCASSERRARVPGVRERYPDDRSVYAALVRAAVVDGSFDFERFEQVLDKALAEEIPTAAASGILEGVESIFTQLGVLPFDERELPPEDPRTF